jgi:hypothetical protein
MRASDIAKVNGPIDRNVTQRNGRKVGARSNPDKPVRLNTMDAATNGALHPLRTAKGGTIKDMGKPIMVNKPNARAAAAALTPESSIRAGGRTANQVYAIDPDTANIAMMEIAVGDLNSETGAVTMGKVAVMTASWRPWAFA